MNLTLRVISALMGVALLAATTYFGQSQGLVILCGLIILGSLNEFRRIAFAKSNLPLAFQLAFFAACIATILSLFQPQAELQLIGTFSSLSALLSIGLWTLKPGFSNEDILRNYGMAVIGFIYCAVFPSLVLKTLIAPQGVAWFYSLLVIVFSGDTLAYFGGKLFGKVKVYEQISPKKTIAGSVSGALGSAILGGAYFFYFFPSIPIAIAISFCFICGLAAQSGDLFISLIKRVADVKDSGKLMPGHGGILDRLDGIYMAAPLVYSVCLLWKAYYTVIP